MEKAQDATYFVAELNAQKLKSHAVGEILIMPPCKITAAKMQYEKSEKCPTFKQYC
jgi:hypothetical protein